MLNTGQPTKTGIYDFTALSQLQDRNAWHHEFEYPAQQETMKVGDTEEISFRRRREPVIYSRSEAEFSLIKDIVSTGSVPREAYATLDRIRVDTQQIKTRLQALEGTVKAVRSNERTTREIEAAIEEVKLDKIRNAAGYIIARNNLWVVSKASTDSNGVHDSSIKVSVARLTGLAVSDEGVLPVVVGKNGLTGYVGRAPFDKRFGTMHPLNVLQSQRAY